MFRVPSRRLNAGGLLTVLLLLSVSAASYSAARARYRGRTSQHRLISFAIYRGRVRTLQFRINDLCPNGHVYLVHDWGFPPIRIRHSKFDQSFASPPKRASATVKRRTFRKRVTGSLSDRRFIATEHSYCQGTATFDLRRVAPPAADGEL